MDLHYGLLHLLGRPFGKIRINPVVFEYIDDLHPRGFVNGEERFVEFLKTPGLSLSPSTCVSPGMLLGFILTFRTVTEYTVLTSPRPLPGCVLPEVDDQGDHDNGKGYRSSLKPSRLEDLPGASGLDFET